MSQKTIEQNWLESKPVGLTMQAVEYDEYGDADVLHMPDHPVPQRLRGQLMIEVLPSRVNPINYRVRRGEMKLLILLGIPRVPGYDVAGIVAESESDSGFAVGDHVMAFLDHPPGGASADYAVCSDSVGARIPDSMLMQAAAATFSVGTTALQSPRDHGKLKRGQTALVNGAIGGVEMFSVQIGKHCGCQVDAIASSRNEESCLSIGLDHFYDYEEDFTKSNEPWEIIFGVASKEHYLKARAVLKDRGHYASTEPSIKGLLMTIPTWPLSKSVRGG